ncbi:hypothetical protein GCM10020219_069850 [Nonomuraea dietziae]
MEASTCSCTLARMLSGMPIMSQMTWMGRRAATWETKSPGPLAITSSTMRAQAFWMSACRPCSILGLKARETMRRSLAWRGSSMLTIDSPNTCLTQPGGSGLVTAGSLEKTLALRLASTTSAWRTRA